MLSKRIAVSFPPGGNYVYNIGVPISHCSVTTKVSISSILLTGKIRKEKEMAMACHHQLNLKGMFSAVDHAVKNSLPGPPKTQSKKSIARCNTKLHI